MANKVCGIALILMTSTASYAAAIDSSYTGRGFPYDAFDQLPFALVPAGASEIRVGFAPGALALPRNQILAWIKKSAEAVATYYGGFPVPTAKVLIVPGAGAGIHGGQTFGYKGPAIRLIVGSDSTENDLISDWQSVHEMVHLALPDMPDKNLWLSEGLAVYVESIARVQAGDLSPEKIWSDFVRDMDKGLPQEGDQGLDVTHTWGRTYWGGAIFCLLADIELRKQTGNTAGLQRAMQAVVAAGGTHDRDWPIDDILTVADTATATHVMRDLYAKMRDAPYDPGLPKLWNELGIQASRGQITFDDTAPLAPIRLAITAKP